MAAPTLAEIEAAVQAIVDVLETTLLARFTNLDTAVSDVDSDVLDVDATISALAGGFNFIPIKKLSYDTPTNSFTGEIVDSEKVGQTFTPSDDYHLTEVQLELYKVGSPGNVTVSIYDTNPFTGYPLGTVLSSYVIPEDFMPTSYGWVSIPLSGSLEKDIKYAIQISAVGVDASNKICYSIGDSGSGSSEFSGGDRIYTVSSVWSTDSTEDILFKTFSEGNSNPQAS
jgi:hypothetical protein